MEGATTGSIVGPMGVLQFLNVGYVDLFNVEFVMEYEKLHSTYCPVFVKGELGWISAVAVTNWN